MGNHDHFWIGSIPVNDALRQSYLSDTVIATGDVLADPRNIDKPDYYMGVLDGSTPNGVEKPGSQLGWWNDPRNAVTQADLIAELQSHPNFILWLAGHRHLNTVKAFSGATPENGFWQVETSSLRDFPQQFRMFELYLNSDDTVSVLTTNVDPAVKAGTPAAQSRAYAVAAQQIINTNIGHTNPTADPSIRPMLLGSYNAELVKKLSPAMALKMRQLSATAKHS